MAAEKDWGGIPCAPADKYLWVVYKTALKRLVTQCTATEELDYDSLTWPPLSFYSKNDPFLNWPSAEGLRYLLFGY